MLCAHAKSTIGYWKQNGFRNPEDADNCPFTFAHGKRDMSFFDILESMPEEMEVFKEYIATVSVLGVQQLVQLFDFGKLLPNKEGVVLVDVGGGKGHVINEIRNVYPEMKGFVLQDLKVVLDGSVLVDEEVELIPYDFFKSVQPVKGTFNYSSSRNFMVTLCLKAPIIFSKPSCTTGLMSPASPYSPISPRP